MTRLIALTALLLLGAAPVPQAAPPLPAQTAPAAVPAQQAPGLVVDVTGGVSAPMPIAIPAMPTAAVAQTAAGSTDGTVAAEEIVGPVVTRIWPLDRLGAPSSSTPQS